MELRHLRYFLAIAREGNVTKAARSLHVSQPTLSRQMSDLEAELGCELLLREPRGITLTDDGMLLRRHAEEIVSLADRAELELRTQAAELEGEVWVGGGESRAVERVAKVASDMRKEYPKVSFHLFSGNAVDVEERVEKGLVDFGVVLGRAPGDRFEWIDLNHTDGWGLLVRADDELAQRGSLHVTDLYGLPLIVSSQKASQDLEGPLHELEEKAEVVATYTLLYNASLLVEAGMGAALCLSGIIYAGAGSPFALLPVTGLPEAQSMLIRRRFQPLSRAADLFWRRMREECMGEATR